MSNFIHWLAHALRRLAEALDAGRREKAPHNLWQNHWTEIAAYDPALIPPLNLLLRDAPNLEEWFRWAEEWDVLLRIFGKLTRSSSVLEIGCGFGRIAFPLRIMLSSAGSYRGFDIQPSKIGFLQDVFHGAYPNFDFRSVDLANTAYNPGGSLPAAQFQFPYPDNSFDLVFAASIFTHMLPEATQNYFRQSARVLRQGGRCVFSFFLMDYYRKGQERPLGFSKPYFNLDHEYKDYGPDFAIADPNSPEELTGYTTSYINKIAKEAGLSFVGPPLPGIWSGSSETWVGSQDLVVLVK